jgi:hypothetical protein
VAQSELAAGLRVNARAVAAAVVRHDALDLNAVVGKPRQRAAQEGGSAGSALVWQDLCVGQPRVVIDHHVDEIPTGDPEAARLFARAAIAVHAMAGLENPAELLDINVHELAGAAPLVAVGRLRRLEPRALAEPDPLQPSETVESAIESASEISAAVIRSSRRSALIASTRSAGVRCGDPLRRRAAVEQPSLALGPKAREPTYAPCAR